MINLPNLLTVSNMMCGSLSIIFSLSGRIDLAIIAILLGMCFDFLDGFTARLLKKSSSIGKQLDSLADIITFGLAPGILMMVIIIVFTFQSQIDISLEPNVNSHVRFQISQWISALLYNVPTNFDASIMYLPFSALFIPFFSIFRLAKFNLDENQKLNFIGLPTPMNSFFFLFFPLYFILNYHQWHELNDWIRILLFDIYFLSALCLLMSVLLISKIPLLGVKFNHFSLKGNEIKIALILTSSIIIFIMKVWAIPIIVFLYLTLSVIDHFNKKNKNEI